MRACIYMYIYLLKPFRQLVIYLRCVYVVDYKVLKLRQQVVLTLLRLLHARLLHAQGVKSSTGDASSPLSTDYDEEAIAF